MYTVPTTGTIAIPAVFAATGGTAILIDGVDVTMATDFIIIRGTTGGPYQPIVPA